jgi:hypothetical protein
MTVIGSILFPFWVQYQQPFTIWNFPFRNGL